MSETLKGRVKWFNDAKGFGFIEHTSGKDVFVHYSVIDSEGFKTLKDGEMVEYELQEGAKGLHASRVKRISVPEKTSLEQGVEQITVETTINSTDDEAQVGSSQTAILASEEATAV